MSSSSSAPRGVLLGGLGALAALASLWLPWYTIKLPDSFRDMLGNIGGTGAGAGAPGGTGAASGAEGLAGAFAGMFKSLAAVMPEEITANGWTAMSGGDVALAVAAGIVVLLVIIVGGVSSGVRVDRGVAGRMMAFAGLVVTGVAVYHVISKPGAGAGAFSADVAIKPGLWVALLGGILMIAGGLLTSSTPKTAAAESAPTPSGTPGEGSMFAPPVDGDVTMAMPDPFAAPAVDPFAAPAPAPEAAHDPFGAPEPDVASADAHDSFASPEPYAAPTTAHDPFASPEPYATPTTADPEPVVSSPDPYPSSDPVVSSDPYPSPDPVAQPEPYAVPEPYGYTSAAPSEPVAQASADTPVPDWSGFQPEPAPEPEPAMSAQASEPRPAGVSIPPPGWTGAA